MNSLEMSEKKEIPTQEFRDFLKKLKEGRSELSQHQQFLHEHKFSKEVDHIRTKLAIIDQIRNEFELVLDGHYRGIDVIFKFKND